MNRFPWDPAYAVGHEALDAQHQQLLACCEALVQADEPDNAGFDARLKTLLALAEEHFDGLLAASRHEAIWTFLPIEGLDEEKFLDSLYEALRQQHDC